MLPRACTALPASSLVPPRCSVSCLPRVFRQAPAVLTGETTRRVMVQLSLGIFNGIGGTFTTACGYALQKKAYQELPEGQSVLRSKLYVLGLVCLTIGAVSSTANFGLLGQSAMAPLAAVTLLWNALLGRLVLKERYDKINCMSTTTIILGVGLAVSFADNAPQEFTLQSLLALYLRWGKLLYIGIVFGIMVSWRIRMRKRPSLQKTVEGLVHWGFMAGWMASVTGLSVKTVVETVKADVSGRSSEEGLGVTKFGFWFFALAIAPCLYVQLWHLNRGIKFFDSVLFAPIYHVFIIFSDAISGAVFFEDFSGRNAAGIAAFAIGCLVTAAGVLILMRSPRARPVLLTYDGSAIVRVVFTPFGPPFVPYPPFLPRMTGRFFKNSSEQYDHLDHLELSEIEAEQPLTHVTSTDSSSENGAELADSDIGDAGNALRILDTTSTGDYKRLASPKQKVKKDRISSAERRSSRSNVFLNTAKHSSSVPARLSDAAVYSPTSSRDGQCD